LLLGRSRQLLDDYSLHLDEEGIAWATKTIAGHGFAFTWLGPGWVFDAAAQQRKADELQQKRAAMTAADAERHRRELDAVMGRIRLGPMAERLLWLIHQQVLRLRSSLLQLPDDLLAEALWGSQKRPGHWRKEIREGLQGLTWLHLTEGSPGEEASLGTDTVILTHAADLRGMDSDVCQEGCMDQPARPHHHYLINVGRGFLGILEDFVQEEDENGVRSYAFIVAGRRKQSSSLRKVGKSGQLVTVYLPAKLGERKTCAELTPSRQPGTPRKTDVACRRQK
jgi:hypothetical protein